MRYDDMTDERLHELMLEIISDEIDKRQGSVAYDLTYPAAHELMNAYMELSVVYNARMPDTATGSDLDEVVGLIGLERREAVPAQGIALFSGDAGEIIPEGTRLLAETTSGEIYFVTDEDMTLNSEGIGSVSVTAEEGGAIGNIGVGELVAVSGYLADVVSVTNEEPFEGGVDEEDDESLRQRFYDRVRLPITSGNLHHYRQWAMEVPGVGDAKVFPVWNGPGTVKVVIVDSEMKPPAHSIVDATYNHIEEERPIGADVTVSGATELPINVSATVELASWADVESVTADFTEALEEYLGEIAFTGELIRYTQIATILLGVPDIIDYTELSVNGGTSNIEPTVEEVGIVGEVTFDVGEIT